MKILYISVHSILEYNEISLLTEMGHEVFSLGAYHNGGHPSLPRPSIPGLKVNEELNTVYTSNPNRNDLDPCLIDWADVIWIMHEPNILSCNWPKIRHKKVIWRSIGQSLPYVEDIVFPLRSQGLKVVRYSPKEMKLPHFAGADAFIRFHEDQNELGNWTGFDPSAINFTQTLKGRRIDCHYDQIVEILAGFPSKVYGTGNEDLGVLNGGELSWDLMKGRLRDSRVAVYGGTWPAPYTLSFIEYGLTGIPVVSIGKGLAENLPGRERIDFFEIPEMYVNGEEIYYAEDMTTLRSYVYALLNDYDMAKEMSRKFRERSLQYFSKNIARDEWDKFLKSL